MSSIAAHPMAIVPIVVVSIRQSLRIRVSAGRAVMDSAVPTNRLNAVVRHVAMHRR